MTDPLVLSEPGRIWRLKGVFQLNSLLGEFPREDRVIVLRTKAEKPRLLFVRCSRCRGVFRRAPMPQRVDILRVPLFPIAAKLSDMLMCLAIICGYWNGAVGGTPERNPRASRLWHVAVVAAEVLVWREFELTNWVLAGYVVLNLFLAVVFVAVFFRVITAGYYRLPRRVRLVHDISVPSLPAPGAAAP